MLLLVGSGCRGSAPHTSRPAAAAAGRFTGATGHLIDLIFYVGLKVLIENGIAERFIISLEHVEEKVIEIEGEGHEGTVLMISPLGGDAGFWRRQAVELSKHFRVITFDKKALTSYLPTAIALRQAKYDAVIDCMVTAPSVTTRTFDRARAA